ncbi:hypothetical protein BaRGS_00027561 [Batillaria attramentaria]|uniref:HTH psq-type domain-containing protein n=1 Tax=Batillaria attramentaria TaxID=370345 RepID=A0ABD0K2R6_9CAEN
MDGGRSYSDAHDPWLINEAAMRVRLKQLSVRKAAAIYNIPRSSIWNRVTGKVKFSAIRSPKPRRKPRQPRSKESGTNGSLWPGKESDGKLNLSS